MEVYFIHVNGRMIMSAGCDLDVAELLADRVASKLEGRYSLRFPEHTTMITKDANGVRVRYKNRNDVFAIRYMTAYDVEIKSCR